MNQQELEEIEKNLNYVEDMLFNVFKFKNYAETIIDYKLNRRKDRHIQALQKADLIVESFEKGLMLGEPYTNLRKAHFNTLKEKLKNVIRNAEQTKK